ncbi:UNVERIFIED_CONTAM: hypothetical protein NCL1_58559 [Trichonephila clavipes]
MNTVVSNKVLNAGHCRDSTRLFNTYNTGVFWNKEYLRNSKKDFLYCNNISNNYAYKCNRYLDKLQNIYPYGLNVLYQGAGSAFLSAIFSCPKSAMFIIL